MVYMPSLNSEVDTSWPRPEVVRSNRAALTAPAAASPVLWSPMPPRWKGGTWPGAVSNEAMPERDAIVVDPMLATGHSSAAAIDRVKEAGPRSVRFVALVSSPEGVRHLAETHPDVRVYTGALDRQLNEKGYILPGLGDAGDRIFGTR